MFVPIWVMVLAFVLVCIDNAMRASRHRRELEDAEARLNKLNWKYQLLRDRRECGDDY